MYIGHCKEIQKNLFTVANSQFTLIETCIHK